MSTLQTSKAHSNGQERKHFEFKGAEGALPIPAGDFYFDTKARNERLMTRELSRGARQTHAALAPDTMYYRREVALRPDGKPTTTSDLCKRTGFDKALQNRFLDELQKKGYGERRCTDDGNRRKGKVLIISWAYPRKPEKENCGRARPQFPGWIPDTWQNLRAYANRCRYKIPPNLELDEDARVHLLEEGERIARGLEEAEEGAARFWDSVLAQGSHNKEDRNDRNNHKEAGRQVNAEPGESTERSDESLPACPSPVENQNRNATPRATTAEQILELPEVQQLQIETGDVISRKFAGDVAADLRDAPVEGFSKVLALRRKRGQFHAGLLRNLASGYADSNDIHKRSVQAKSDAVSRQMEEQTARTCRNLWEGYNESERKQALRDYPEMPWPSG